MTDDPLLHELEQLAGEDRRRDEERFGPAARPDFARQVTAPRPSFWARLFAPLLMRPFRTALATAMVLMVVAGGALLWPRRVVEEPVLEASIDIDPTETIAELDDEELRRVLARLEKIR